jgi:signal transduction histidine kinase/CheY-like chemotaxis protein
MDTRILIVSDSPTQCLLLQTALEEQGYKTTTAVDGLTALNCIYKDLPSLVVSDVVLPNLNGYQLCRLVKNDPHTTDVPFVLLTSLDEKVDSFWGLEAGADLYLKKQSDSVPIIQAIKQVLDERKAPGDGKMGSSLAQVFTPLFSGSDAQSRLAALLDQLLFKMTVRGAVRGAAREVYDRPALHNKIFELLGRMFDYGLAVLVVQSEGNVEVVADAQTRLTLPDIHKICEAYRGEPAEGADQRKLRIDIFDPEKISDSALAFTPHSQASTEFEIDKKTRGVLALYSIQNKKYDEETRNILEIVGDELVLILRSLAKYDELEQLKADFIAMLVHDLRSPLTTLIGFSDLLLANPQEKLSEWQQDRVTRMSRKSKDLLKLVNDMLDLSKYEAGHAKLELAEMDVKALLTQVSDDMTATAKEAGVNLSLDVKDVPAHIQADRRQLERVCINLVSNAIKFTPKDGNVSIHAQRQALVAPVSASVPKFIEIRVVDTGTGIPEEGAAKLFSKYERAHNTQYSGTGLGLAICKQVVEAHGGRIWLESQPGKGTTFTLLLPVNGPSAGLVLAEKNSKPKEAETIKPASSDK